MTSTSRDNSVKLLQQQYKHVKGEQDYKVASLIELYKLGNIENINTARYAINRNLIPTAKPQRALLDYFKNKSQIHGTKQAPRE